jgi:hypothetical protein
MGGAALGGLIGGVITERAAVVISERSMLLVLAALHVFCASAISLLSSSMPAVAASEGAQSSGFSVLRGSRYAQHLALLVFLSTIASTLIDYVFKAQAVATLGGGPPLLRFFALFYAGAGFLTFLLQTLISHVALARLGIARTVASLPLAVLIGAIATLVFPGMPSFTALRATESSLSSSLYKSGYELFFTPMSTSDKRSLKTLIDVGFDRIGDAFGGGLLKLVPAIAGATTVTALLGTAAGLAVLVLLVAIQLHRGYVRTLEQRLRERALDLDLSEVNDSTTLSVLRTIDVPVRMQPVPVVVHPEAPVDPLLKRVADLVSRDVVRVKRALAEGPLSLPLVPHCVALLAWDDVAKEALAALAPMADSAVGDLETALRSPDEEFAVRRRVPRVLEMGVRPAVISALLAGLDDARFEVRYRCGRALARIHRRAPDAVIESARIFAAVLKEAVVDRGVWESQRLLDEEPPEEEEFVDELVRDRASRSLEHVFTLLSLAFPRRPLVLAFHGLYTDDEHLRGTALEYLEGVLPADVRAALWPYLEDSRPPERSPQSRAEALERLLRSHGSIQLNLEEARRRLRAEPG